MKKRKKGMVYKFNLLRCLILFLPLFLYVRYVLVFLKRIKIHNKERLPKVGAGEVYLYIVDHRTYISPPLAYSLFLPRILRGVIRALRRWDFDELDRNIPLVAVASEYYDSFLIWLLGLQSIFVRIDRNDETGTYSRLGAVRQIERYISKKEKDILFSPEGMRLKKNQDKIESPKGNAIGRFKPGIAWLAGITERPIVSVGTKGTERVLPDKSPFPYFLLFFSWFLMLWRGPVNVNIGKPLIIQKRTFLQPVSSREEKHAARKTADYIVMETLLATLDEIT